MDEKWIEEIKHNDGIVLLNRFFPGKSCGNPECEKRCIDFCRIALRMGAMKPEEVTAVVAPQLVIPENCPALQVVSNYICRFHVLLNSSIAAYDDNGRKIIGKQYIADGDASKAGACQRCLEYANRIYKWPEEAERMPELPRHPNCKCHYENIYETSDNEVSIDPRNPENIKMPNMTPLEWNNLTESEKKTWCSRFKSKFGKYISEYSIKNNVPQMLLALIMANELIDWRNVDGTALDGIRGGGVGFVQISVDTAIREMVSGFEEELTNLMRQNNVLPDSIAYRIICGKVHQKLLTTRGSVEIASRLLHRYIEYYENKVARNHLGTGFKKNGLFFMKCRSIFRYKNLSELNVPEPVMRLFCAMWNSGKEILDAVDPICDKNYKNAFIHAENAEILFEFLPELTDGR